VGNSGTVSAWFENSTPLRAGGEQVPRKKSSGSGPSSTARMEQWESSGVVRRKETSSETLSQKTLQVLQYLVVL